MTTDQTGATHGGPRPAVRPDDGRYSNPGGPGRKPTKFTFAVGKKFWVAPHMDKGTLDTELWTVTDIDRKCVTITSDNGITYRIHR